MPFDIFNSSGAKIAENISDWNIEEYSKQGLLKPTDKVVEINDSRKVNPASKMHKGVQSTKVAGKYSPRLGKYATQRKMNAYGQTAIARDINNVKKRRG